MAKLIINMLLTESLLSPTTVTCTFSYFMDLPRYSRCQFEFFAPSRFSDSSYAWTDVYFDLSVRGPPFKLTDQYYNIGQFDWRTLYMSDIGRYSFKKNRDFSEVSLSLVSNPGYPSPGYPGTRPRNGVLDGGFFSQNPGPGYYGGFTLLNKVKSETLGVNKISFIKNKIDAVKLNGGKVQFLYLKC